MAEVEEFVWGTKLFIQYAPTALSVYVGPKQIIFKNFFERSIFFERSKHFLSKVLRMKFPQNSAGFVFSVLYLGR